MGRRRRLEFDFRCQVSEARRKVGTFWPPFAADSRVNKQRYHGEENSGQQLVPKLRVPTLAHGEFDLASDVLERFTLITFYSSPCS